MQCPTKLHVCSIKLKVNKGTAVVTMLKLIPKLTLTHSHWQFVYILLYLAPKIHFKPSWPYWLPLYNTTQTTGTPTCREFRGDQVLCRSLCQEKIPGGDFNKTKLDLFRKCRFTREYYTLFPCQPNRNSNMTNGRMR